MARWSRRSTGMRGSVSVSMPDSITPDAGRGTTDKLAPDQKAAARHLPGIATSTPRRSDAQRIVNRLAQVFVEENSSSREVRAQDTSQFIDTQLQASAARLNALEAQLRAKKEAYMGRLPEQTNANLAMVNGAAQPARVERDDDARRAGSAVDDRAPARSDAAGRRRRACAADQRHAGRDGADRASSTLRRSSPTRSSGYTDKHPEVHAAAGGDRDRARRTAAAERADAGRRSHGDARSRPRCTASRCRSARVTKMRIAELQRQQRRSRSADRRSTRPASRRADGRAADGLAAARVRPRTRRRTPICRGKKQTALLAEELQRKQGGEQFSVLVPGQPARREPFKPKPMRVMLMAIAARPRARRALARRPRVSSTARCTTPAGCATNSSCRCWRKSRASKRSWRNGTTERRRR